jgi:pyruvate-formate lyase
MASEQELKGHKTNKSWQHTVNIMMEYQTTTRVERLRSRMNEDAHGVHRVVPPKKWSVTDKTCSLAERRAHALYMACEQMPIAIEPDELIVGLRTLVLKKNSNSSPLPTYNKRPKLWPWGRDSKFRPLSGRSVSHNIPGFNKIIQNGMGALADEAGENLRNNSDPLKQDHLSSFIIACEAVGVILKRYSDLAHTLATQTEDPTRQTELENISSICNNLILNPPQNLQEALQLYWITWSLIVLEVGVLVSMGRIDQVLAPFWPKDPDQQVKAQELIDCFIVKCNDQNEMWVGISLINNQVMLSGLTRDGVDATNPVTWAILSALDRLNMPDPQPAVRLHDRSPRELTLEICRLWRKGRAQLSVYNDDVFVPALNRTDIKIEDARDYAIDACQDISIFGKSDFYIGAGIDMANLLVKAIEKSPRDANWDTFISIFKTLVRERITDFCESYNKEITTKRGIPCPLLSLSLDNCIETGLDFSGGGLAIGHKGVIIGTPVTMINSLAALKSIVFDQGIVTLGEMWDACKADWDGFEELQLKSKDAPKWGNDLDSVDLLGAEILRFAAEEIWKQRLPDGSRYLSGIHQAHHVTTGFGIRATPDGRNEGDPVPPTLAPANGTATKGPTAIMKSVTKIDPTIAQWNSSLTLVLNPSSISGDGGLMKFDALLRTWLQMRGPQLQVNVVSREMLEAAKADPASHRDLIVRIWGFCDRFVSITPLYQDELIERTPQSL